MRYLLFVSIILLISCQQEINPSILINQTTDSAAHFNFIAASGNSSNAVPSGSYVKGMTLDSSNTLSFAVHVSIIGKWSASTNSVNNISFRGSGRFSAIGDQSIILYGSGTPSKVGPNNFSIQAGSNQCSFTLLVDSNSTQIPSVNIPPVANAGQDITITLPTNNAALYGSGTDADGTITGYNWSKVSGPGQYSISTPNQPQTNVSGLIQGTYQFELKVTDSLGAVGKDTVMIQVNGGANAQNGNLSMQQEIFGLIIPSNEVMHYDASGKIDKINSDSYPNRVITYNNNKIVSVEYWFNSGNGSYYKGESDEYVYDGNGNVITINRKDAASGSSYKLAEYSYNADHTMQRKKLFFSSGSGLIDNAFIYTNGNLTGIISDPDSYPDTVSVQYDNRKNNFTLLYPQNYFLDILTAYDQTYRSEIFYFSKNYPISIGSKSVQVSINTSNQKPFEIRIDNDLWYRYLYN